MYANITEEQKSYFFDGKHYFIWKFDFFDLGLVIENEMLYSESVKLSQAISTSEDFELGGCIASSISFITGSAKKIDLKGQMFKASLLVKDTDFELPMGEYTVDTAELVDDKDYKQITAYDAFYSMSDDATDWYNWLFDNNSTVTLKMFREGLLQHFNVPYESKAYKNDDMVITKLASIPNNFSGQELLKMCCELAAGYGVINRYGKFEIIGLTGGALFPEEGLYPEETLYPEEQFSYLAGDSETSPTYRTAKYSEFITAKVSCLQMLDVNGYLTATIGGDTSNPYILSGNYLLNGKTAEEMLHIGQPIYAVISNSVFKPCNVELQGSPYLDLGDYLIFEKNEDDIITYIFERELNGIQGLKDTYIASGNEYRNNEISQKDLIAQLNAKAQENVEAIENVSKDLEDKSEELQENIDGVSEDLGDYKETVSHRFEATDEALTSEYNRATKAEGALNSLIQQTAESIVLAVEKTYQTKTDAGTVESKLRSEISQTAESITSTVSANYETKSDANSKKTSLESQISQTASEISSKVSAGDVCSTISQRSDAIDISANRISINSDYFSLTKNGNITAKAGTIGGWTIGQNALYNSLDNINDISSYGIYFSPTQGLRMNSIPNGGIFLGARHYYSGGGGYRGDQLTLRSNYLDFANSGSNGKKAILGCWDSSGLPSLILTDSNNYLATKIGMDESYFKGEVTFNDNIVNMSWYNNTSSDSSNAHIGSGGRISRVTSSSKRYKHDIKKDIKNELNPHRLYDVGIYQYKFNDDYLSPESDRYKKDVIGFVVEDMVKHYPIAVDYAEIDGEKVPENWNDRYIIPALTKLVQEQHQEIENLKSEVAKLKQLVNTLLKREVS